MTKPKRIAWLSVAAFGALLARAGATGAQTLETLGPEVRKYVCVATPRVVLEHVEVVDGTGGAPSADRNVVIENGKVTAITAGADQPTAAATTILDLRGYAERAFVGAGGLLIAGADPVGNGGVIPGFGDQREIELLVEAGFAPVEAIKIATPNGATSLGRQGQIGSIAFGKNADIVVVKGDPAAHIMDIENVEIVFKDGVGYDTAKLLEAVTGHYGEY